MNKYINTKFQDNDNVRFELILDDKLTVTNDMNNQ